MKILRKKTKNNKVKLYLFGIKIYSYELPYNKSKQEPNSLNKYSYSNSSYKLHKDTQIGKYCSIGHNALIGASSHPTSWLSTSPFQYSKDFNFPNAQLLEYQSRSPVNIGNDVWIGANVVIFSGLTVGDGAIIGAGAVVTKDVPPYAIVVGMPAKVLKYRFDNKTIKTLQKLKWWDLDEEYIANLPFDNIQECIKILTTTKSKLAEG